jgi:hypothetical protein
MPAESWRRALRRATWLRDLSAQTSQPSTPGPFAESLTSWLAEARAKTSVSPVSAPASTESEAASSGTSFESSESVSPASSSGRTLAAQLELFPESSKPSLRRATEAQPSPFALLTWERPTADYVSSFWPAATAMDSRSSGRAAYSTSGVTLTDAMSGWRSPTARDGSGTGPADRVVRLSQGHSVGLKDQVSTWPTPAARDFKGANAPEHLAKARGHHDQLPNAVAMRGHLAQETPPGGQPTLPTEAPRRLNPDFVEALMGWPKGFSVPYARRR